MNADALIPSKYIKAADFGVTLPRFPTLTIADEGRIETVPSLKPGARDGDEEKKGVLYFTDEPSGRGWVINKTNNECLKALFGKETRDWVGKRVTLMAAPINSPVANEGIRIQGSPDIDREVKVVVKLKKRKPQTFTLIPTGRTNSNGNATAPRQQPNQAAREPERAREPRPSPLDVLRTRAPDLGLDYDMLVTWLENDGAVMDALNYDDIEAIASDVAPDGPRRAEIDAFAAARTSGQ